MHEGMEVHGGPESQGAILNVIEHSLSDQRQGGRLNGPPFPTLSLLKSFFDRLKFHLFSGARSIFPYLNNNERVIEGCEIGY